VTLIASILAIAVGAFSAPEAPRRRIAPRPPHVALASWYDDTGATASGRHYPHGFASLMFGSQWGRRVRFCYRGRCAVGRLDDHGPYVSGRGFDLNASLRYALRCPDLCWVRW